MKQMIMSLLAAFFMIAQNVMAEGLKGTTPVSGESYYLYSTVQKKFMNDNNGFDANPTVLWTVSGNFPGNADGSSSFSLTSANGKQFAMYRSGNFWNYQYNVVSNAEGKSGSEIALAAAQDANGCYSFCRAKKSENWSGDRNVASKADGSGFERTKDASYEWIYVTQQEIDDMKNVEEGGDLSDLVPTTWVGQTGKVGAAYMKQEAFVGAAERYQDGAFTGDVMTQTMTGMKNGQYKVVLHGAASYTSGRGFEGATGENHAYFFANDALQSLTVYDRTEVADGDVETAELTCTVSDGTLKFGIQNITIGANWFVVALESVTYVSETIPTTDQLLSVGDAKWSTFMAPFEVDVPAGVTAYTVDALESDGLTLTLSSMATIPANTPVLLYAESPVSETVSGVKSAENLTYTVGLLTGTYGALEITDGYVMQKQGGKVGFYAVSAENPKTVPANKAYLTVPASGVKAFYFDGEATAIDALEALQAGEAQVYDLNGRALNGLKKGVNIVNGKKIWVK